MIASARARIDIAEFYASNEPGSRLEPVVQALLVAVGRGVRVRWLADAKFAETYPETLQRLSASGVQIHAMNSLHAKYFVVDGREAFIGSQNFDWRSLTHIEELGIRFRAPDAVRALQDIFETDWSGKVSRPSSEYLFDEVTLVASPREKLPLQKLWDLPALVELIDSAKDSVRVQLLTYGGVPELQEALVRAAARGVLVQLLVSDWELRPRTLAQLRTLTGRTVPEPGGGGTLIEVSIFTIPQWSGGFVPFARVAHAKYCVVDAARGWVGTGNWEPDYFLKSRNVGLLIDGGPVPPRLDVFFRENWASKYAAPFDPSRDYAPPRISSN
jgi:phosphatidylserine/phosphatidylglycerophosphate/cardiolipin synthase-like enzyme